MKYRTLLCVLVAASTVAVCNVAAPVSSAAAAATPKQLITVRSLTSTSTTAVLEALQQPASGGPYVRMHAPIYAHVGAHGIGPTHEGARRTPAGTFGLTEAYGRNPYPGSGLPYKQLDWYDWWVSDVNSAYYNMHERCGGTIYCPFNVGKSERLMAYNPAYNYLAVINYNRSAVVRGAGSAFFLHVTTGGSTAGCVAVGQSDMIWLLRWLNKAYSPRIQIFVTP